MDSIDVQIINILKNNARAYLSDISQEIHLSVPATSERLKKLEESGIIAGYTAKLSRKKMKLNLLAYIFVIIENNKYIPNFRSIVSDNEHVLECHHIAGEYDYLLKVVVEDTKALEFFVSNFLKAIPGVGKTLTHIVFSTIKEVSC